MDVFSLLIPHPSYINDLPSLYIFNIPVSIIVYIVLLFSIIFFLYRRQREYLIKVVLSVWFIISLLYSIQAGIQVYAENTVFGGKSLDILREMTTSNGLYSFLNFAQSIIPKDEPVRCFFPTDSAYYYQKAPYYLYPHTITDSAKYLLIFNASNVNFDQEKNKLTIYDKESKGKIIDNVQLLAKYKDNQYILLVK